MSQPFGHIYEGLTRTSVVDVSDFHSGGGSWLGLNVKVGICQRLGTRIDASICVAPCNQNARLVGSIRDCAHKHLSLVVMFGDRLGVVTKQNG
jgi:hypothetical protein